jgi:hypothetical protein
MYKRGIFRFPVWLPKGSNCCSRHDLWIFSVCGFHWDTL